jgi:hypothetical protein
MPEITVLQNYSEFRREFDTKLVYTRRDFAEFRNKLEEEYVINRVIMRGKDINVALQILAIHKTPEGITVVVK